jgi:RNA polymerase sigma-70 factor, ECF subfamily
MTPETALALPRTAGFPVPGLRVHYGASPLAPPADEGLRTDIVEVRTLPLERKPDEVGERVVAAACRGDHKAFVTIMRHYDRRLRLIAFRLLRDRDLMDDALQDVAIKAFRALPAFRGQSALGTWLYRITYTTCLDYLRRAHPVELYPSDELPEPRDVGPDFAETIGERDQLERKLALLTPEQRLAVLLVDQEGFDYRAAGEILGIPAGTVGSRLAVARATPRRSLAPARSQGLRQ